MLIINIKCQSAVRPTPSADIKAKVLKVIRKQGGEGSVPLNTYVKSMCVSHVNKVVNFSRRVNYGPRLDAGSS